MMLPLPGPPSNEIHLLPTGGGGGREEKKTKKKKRKKKKKKEAREGGEGREVGRGG